MKEAVDDEALSVMKGRIADIHDDLEKILYNAHLAVDGNVAPERLAEINNIVLELEKSTLNLGSAVTKEDNNDIGSEDLAPLPKEEK